MCNLNPDAESAAKAGESSSPAAPLPENMAAALGLDPAVLPMLPALIAAEVAAQLAVQSKQLIATLARHRRYG